MRAFAALALAVLLAGCVTQAERTAQMQREVDEMIATYGPMREAGLCERIRPVARLHPAPQRTGHRRPVQPRAEHHELLRASRILSVLVVLMPR